MTDFKNYLRTLTIIHLALVAGQVVFMAVVIAMNGSTLISFNPAEDPLIFAVIGTALMGLLLGPMLGKKLLETVVHKKSTDEKLQVYRTMLIVRYALIEGGSLFGIVAYFLSGNFFFLIISMLLILVMIMLRPTRHKMEEDLKIQLPHQDF